MSAAPRSRRRRIPHVGHATATRTRAGWLRVEIAFLGGGRLTLELEPNPLDPGFYAYLANLPGSIGGMGTEEIGE